MYLMLEGTPGVLLPTEGFRSQLVRRFRSLSDANVSLHDNAPPAVLTGHTVNFHPGQSFACHIPD